MNDWNRFSPIALATEQPVSQAISHFFLTKLIFSQPVDYLSDTTCFIKTIYEVRINVQAIFRIGCYSDITSLDNWNKDRKSTRLNSSHQLISYAVFCLKK